MKKHAQTFVPLQTSLRLDECSRLMLADLEFGERSGHVIVRSGKGNKARTVPLNASARQALAAYLAPRFGCESTIKAVAAAWPCGKGEAAPSRPGRAKSMGG